MANKAKKNNSLVVKSNSKDRKIIFNDKNKYNEAIRDEKEHIHESEERIEELKRRLQELKEAEKAAEKEEKAAKLAKKKEVEKNKKDAAKKKKQAEKQKASNDIPKGQKHQVISLNDFGAYDYDKRRKQWHKLAGHNEEQEVCCVCNDDDNWTSVKLDNGNHICYFCWIKKPTEQAKKAAAEVKPKQEKKKSNPPAVVKSTSSNKKKAEPKKQADTVSSKNNSPAVVKSTKPSDVDYEKIYAIELETLRTAFSVLPANDRAQYEKNIYKMIDHLIEKRFIEKRH